MKHNFFVGDLVDVIDLRDGAVVEVATRITKIEEFPGDHPEAALAGKTYANVSAGFGVNVVCLRKTKALQ